MLPLVPREYANTPAIGLDFLSAYVSRYYFKYHLDDARTGMRVALHCGLLREINVIDETNTDM